MSAKPKPNAKAGSDASSPRKPMPFEPKNKPEAADQKTAAKKLAPQSTKSTKSTKTAATKASNRSATQSGIPEAVSRRMIRRVALFSGIPTALGMSTFILSYLAFSNDWFKLPTYAVLFVSLAWFGLGVLGVSYGILSASWDEESPGSRTGFAELRTNWGRINQNRRANQADKS